MSERLVAARALLEARRLDAVLVSDPTDVRYLSGFRGDDTLLLVSRDAAFICTDSRYFEQARDEAGGFELVRSEGGDLLVADALAAWRSRATTAAGGPRLGFQGDVLVYAGYRRLRRAFDGRLVNLGARVSALRRVKDAGELALLRRAAAITEEALEAVVAGGLAGRSERDVAWAIEVAVHEAGGEGLAFPTIVAAGPHGALPHAIPGDTRIARGDLVVIDMGARLDGYNSDITRTVAVGSVSDEARSVYEVVLRAQLAGLAAVREGVLCRAVDGAARRVIDEAGYGERFGHGTGHGVGLEIHEQPRVARRGGDRLVAGTVVTVEPGVYLEGRFGVRIEDTLAVTVDGCERLTRSTKELRVVD